MAFGTFTLTGTYLRPDGTPHSGSVTVRMSGATRVLDDSGDVVLLGAISVALVDGAFSVILPDPNDVALNPTGFGYSVSVRLSAVGSLPVVTIGPESITADETIDLSDFVTVDPALLNPLATYVSASELADEAAARAAGDALLIPLAQKGAAGGVAALDGSTLVPVAQVPDLPASKITSGTIDDARIPAGIARDTEVTAAVTAHEAAADPHPQYLTPAAANAVYAPLSGAAAYADAWASSKIACLGDSWTTGNQDGTGTTYPGLLATALPWATVSNLGKAGWTSTEIAARWGVPFTLAGFTLPATATPAAVTITAPTKRYRYSNSTVTFSWTGELRQADGTVIAAGTLAHDATSSDQLAGWTFTRTAAGASVAVPSGALFVCTELAAHKDASLVIAVGRNNFMDADAAQVVVRDVNAIRAAHRAPSAPFVVLPVPTSAAQDRTTYNYEQARRVNVALAAAFPNEYLDARRYLVDRGLAVTGTVPSSSSLDQVIGDTIPQSLLFSPDYDHPNAAGYKALAACILDGLGKVGALTGPSSGVTGVNPDALGPTVWSADEFVGRIGSGMLDMLPRSGAVAIHAATTGGIPVLTYDAATGRRYFKFDGVDDEIRIKTGFPQPFTILLRVRVRDLTNGIGFLWPTVSPGSVFFSYNTGRIVNNSSVVLQTAAGVLTANTLVTVAAVVNGASSLVGLDGVALTSGDAGATRSITTEARVGYYFDTADHWAPIDLFEMRLYPWALSAAQVAAVAARMT
jgi:adhesin HecA-like repeat protein